MSDSSAYGGGLVPSSAERAAPRLFWVNEKLSPYEAMLEDLNFLRSALDSAGVDYVLVRSEVSVGGSSRPTIAVNHEDRNTIVVALAKACKGTVMYSTPAKATNSERTLGRTRRRRRRADKVHVLVSSGSLGGDASDLAFMLCRPRASPNHSLRFGAKNGIRLELWIYDDAVIRLPNGNALTRAILPREQAVSTTVNRFGSVWPTLEGMWDCLVDEINFPIDIVFSWVDGNDQEWQQARAARMQGHVVGEGDGHESRFRQINELKYAMRSVHLFAPWVRNIIVATDSPRPEWLLEHPRIIMMPSNQFFADQGVLPTYNSHAIESQLHRIPGLSEHFLYSNDDMFFGREIGPHAFFTSGGVSRFIESHTRIGLGEPNVSRSGFENAARINRALLFQKFGRTISRSLEHAPTPLRRSVLHALESEFPEDFRRTASARFRSATDISVTNSLYHFYALMMGFAVPHEGLRVKYVDTTAREGINALRPLLRKRNFDFFCLNDGSFPDVPAQERVDAVTEFLENYFPIPAPWERIVAINASMS